jgi:hypothetical protein
MMMIMEYNRCAYFIWGVGRVRISTYYFGGVWGGGDGVLAHGYD